MQHKATFSLMALLSAVFGLALASIFYEGGLWIIGKIYCAVVCAGSFLTTTKLMLKK